MDGDRDAGVSLAPPLSLSPPAFSGHLAMGGSHTVPGHKCGLLLLEQQGDSVCPEKLDLQGKAKLSSSVLGLGTATGPLPGRVSVLLYFHGPVGGAYLDDTWWSK